MPEQAGGALRVEVVFALPGKQELISLQVPDGATVAQAIEQSAIADKFPEHDLPAFPVGVWGRVVGRDQRLRDGDRVEIYRPLAIDPQQARRELAAAGKSMGRRGGASSVVTRRDRTSGPSGSR